MVNAATPNSSVTSAHVTSHLVITTCKSVPNFLVQLIAMDEVDVYQNGEDIDDSMFDDPEDYVDNISDKGKDR